MEKPLNIAKRNFINNVEEPPSSLIKPQSQRVSFSLNNEDMKILEEQIDRAVLLKKRNKNKTCIMRMALKALQETSDEKYLELYNKY